MRTKATVGNSYENFPTKMQRNFFIIPILILSFFRAGSLTLLSLGLPNYFIFDLKESSALAGFTLAIYCIPYAILPYFFGKLSDKIGRKNILIISVIGTNLSYVIYLIKFSPLEAFISRFFEGIFTSMFWPILQALISDFKHMERQPEKLIGTYNISWNVGGIVGFILGAIAVFIIGNNNISFYLAWMFGILLIPTVFFLKLYSQKIPISTSQSDNENILAIPPEIITSGTTYMSKIKIRKSKKNKRNGKKTGIMNKERNQEILLHNYPLLIPFLMLILHSFILGSISVIVSTKFEILGIASYTTYILSSFRTLFAVIFSKFAAKNRNKNIARYVLIIGLIYSLPAFLGAFFIRFPFFIIMFVLLGFTSISMYTIALKIMLEKNAAKKTGKYTGFAEGITGIGYGVGPLLMGWISDYSTNLSFILLGSYGVILAVILLITINRAKISRN